VIDFSARFRRLRDTLQLNQEQMAARLHISANYLSQIENGREPSVRVLEVLNRIEEDVARGRLLDGVTLPESMAVAEDAKIYGASTTNVLRQELRQKFDRTIAAAGDNRDRLGWISVQLDTHLRPPANWVDDAAVAEAKRLMAAVRKPSLPGNPEQTQRSG
jgi:transcriptional regulator with XRE-family HTH domain